MRVILEALTTSGEVLRSSTYAIVAAVIAGGLFFRGGSTPMSGAPARSRA